MAERFLVIDHLKFGYEGLFNAAELYSLIAGWFYDKGWDWYEKTNEEQITPQGKQLLLLFEPWKSASDYNKLKVRIKLHMLNVKEVEVEHQGNNLRLNHGVIRITIDGYVITDRKSLWKDKPLWWFLSFIFDMYLFNNHFKKMETWLKSDVDDLLYKIKDYLNVFKYSYQQ